MANDGKRKRARKGRKRRADGYEPSRGSRLKGSAAPEPAPEPLPKSVQAPPGLDDPALLGEGVDDGLRILAALETMESLEPDFCDDPAGEASVTIIDGVSPFEAHVEDADTALADARAAHRGATRMVPDTDVPRTAGYLGPIEEAVVEIFDGPVSTPATAGPSRKKKKARRVAQRFFKALTGDEGG